MRFLVVGASGFVGSHVLAGARRKGHEAMGTESRRRSRDLIPFNLLEDRILDCLPPAYLNSNEPTFGVVCVKYGPMDHYARDPHLARRIEVEGMIQLLKDFMRIGIKPVYLSTSYVFDGTIGYYTEQHARSPLSVYGKNKADVEAFLEDYSQDVLTLRLDRIVGDDPKEEHLFSEWLKCIDRQRPIRCIEGQVFSPTLVDDVASGVLAGTERGLSGLYNLATPEFFARDELARQFVGALGGDVQVVVQPESAFAFRDARPLKTYLDASRFVEQTGLSFVPVRRVWASFRAKLEAEVGVGR